MIAAYHIVFGMYGFWLPNDPRGSWSDFVGSWELVRYGKATTTNVRRSVAHVQHDVQARQAAKKALLYPPVMLNEEQIEAVASGFAIYFDSKPLLVLACAILPDHVHLVLANLPMKAEQVVIQLKGSATEQLVANGIHPLEGKRDKNGRRPKCFARGQWKVYLKIEDVPRAIEYVEVNPEKEGMPRQEWNFVSPSNV